MKYRNGIEATIGPERNLTWVSAPAVATSRLEK